MIILRNILATIVLTPVMLIALFSFYIMITQAPMFLLFFSWFFCAIALIVVQLHVEEKSRNG